MTPPLDLAALRALVEKAPALPYHRETIGECDGNLCIKHEHHDVYRIELEVTESEPRTPGFTKGAIYGRCVNVACVLDGDNGFAELAVAAVNALPALLDRVERGEEAVRAFVAWLDAENSRPDYGTQTRDTHPEGEHIWQEWWKRNQRLCREAQDKGRAFLASIDAALTPTPEQP